MSRNSLAASSYPYYNNYNTTTRIPAAHGHPEEEEQQQQPSKHVTSAIAAARALGYGSVPALVMRVGKVVMDRRAIERAKRRAALARRQRRKTSSASRSSKRGKTTPPRLPADLVHHVSGFVTNMSNCCGATLRIKFSDGSDDILLYAEDDHPDLGAISVSPRGLLAMPCDTSKCSMTSLLTVFGNLLWAVAGKLARVVRSGNILVGFMSEAICKFQFEPLGLNLTISRTFLLTTADFELSHLDVRFHFPLTAIEINVYFEADRYAGNVRMARGHPPLTHSEETLLRDTVLGSSPERRCISGRWVWWPECSMDQRADRGPEYTATAQLCFQHLLPQDSGEDMHPKLVLTGSKGKRT
jgi:hypothetical protein